VTIVGDTNLASAIPTDASAMFSKNVVALVRHLVKDGALALDLADEITRGTLVCHEGTVVHEAVKAKLG
jgi:NAD(P) transhydrogenase subunit alpha